MKSGYLQIIQCATKTQIKLLTLAYCSLYASYRPCTPLALAFRTVESQHTLCFWFWPDTLADIHPHPVTA